MTASATVVVVGAGGDGPALAWRLADAGHEVLVLEAGPWHGNEQWQAPHESPGPDSCDDPASLSGEHLDEQFTNHEDDMKRPTSGKLRWGPADSDRAPWTRTIPQNAFAWQVAGVGGTTLVYLGNHPRAYPASIDEQPHWPISYDELVPYYREIEELLPVRPAPTTPKEELFFHGCREAGWERRSERDVTEPGYRPMPNAILQPDEKLRGDYEGDFTYPEVEGSTLAGQELHGDPHPREAPVSERAKRSTLVSYVPMALETGNCTIRPNAFVTDVHTHRGEATGVTFQDTWRDRTHRVEADVVVLAAGAVETPRLWFNAELPDHDWVGRGLTTHWFDWLVGFFEPDHLEDVVGERAVRPYVGQNGAARFDYPGLGGLAVNAMPPAITAASTFSISQAGYSFDNEVAPDAPWDSRGRVAGRELKKMMAEYPRMLSVIVHTDDHPHRDNRIRPDPVVNDEHGPVPLVQWQPHEEDDQRRDKLARMAAEILRSAGAYHVHRTDQAPVLLHLQSTMALGKVTDDHAEARGVDRLFIADHSVLPNGLGGTNPTHTGQAMALRTADAIRDRYLE